MYPKRFYLMVAAAFLGGLLLNRPADAQFAGDYQTNVFDNITTYFNVGFRFGVGDELQIINGGAVSCTNGTYLGAPSGYIGWGGNNNSAIVSSPGSVWSNSSAIIVGGNSYNTLVISNGGMVVDNLNTPFDLGDILGNGGTGYHNVANVTGSGSKWLNHGDLSVGWYSGVDLMSNSLVVSDGGAVGDINGWVGDNANGNSAFITGTGSVWSNSANLYMQGTSGFLVIGSGGAVSAGGKVLISGTSNSVVIAGSGSVLTGQGCVSIGTNDATGNSLTINGGAVIAPKVTLASSNCLVLNGGALIASNGFVISGSALLKGTGTIYADSTLAGTLAPGSLTNFGNLTLQSSAVLQFALGGTAQSSSYDFVLITNGVASLDGSLQVSFIQGFATNVLNSDRFTLLTADTMSGSFTNVLTGERLMTEADEGSFLVSYDDNNVVLSDYEPVIAIPEPGTWSLLAMGIFALLGSRRLAAPLSSRKNTPDNGWMIWGVDLGGANR